MSETTATTLRQGPTLRMDSAASLAPMLTRLPAADCDAMAEARARQAALTKPEGALGRLEDLAVFMAGWQQSPRPRITAPLCLVFAGNHGVAAAQGISAYPPEVTAEMVANFKNGGAAINQLARHAGAELAIHALDLATPTADFTAAPAMREGDFCRAMQCGIDAVEQATHADIILPGEMGIGNTTIASALAAACIGGDGGGSDAVAAFTGRGTGIDDAALARKTAVIKSALEFHAAPIAGRDPAAILAALGGRETAAIAGAVLAARHRRLPVLLDGFVATASLLPLWLGNKAIFDHCLIAHCSAEKGHAAILEAIGKKPLLDFGMRLGEASGAALALPLLQAALATHNGMASFAEAGVSGKAGG